MHIYLYIHIYVHTYKHTHTNIYTHKYIHICGKYFLQSLTQKESEEGKQTCLPLGQLPQ